MDKNLLEEIACKFGICYQKITREIDSSRENDHRLNVVLDDKYVLRENESRAINEKRLAGIARLIERYNSVGIHSPRYFKSKEGSYSYTKGDKIYYLSGYDNHTLASEEENIDEDNLLRDICHYLGIIAQKFTGVDLMDERSMWSIIDLAPLDEEIDERQENLNELKGELVKQGFLTLAKRLDDFNNENRNSIKKVFEKLPRCVYQGDMNNSNILVENGKFYGLIDYNLSGTEVNINCFLSETNRGVLEDDFEKYSPLKILEKMIEYQNRYLDIIFENYTLNSEEKQVFENYRNIVLISQYPNVCDYIDLLKGDQREKVAQFIELLTKR